MRSSSAKCSGFKFSTVPLDVVLKWDIPGIKISSDGVLRSCRCKLVRSYRSPLCSVCRKTRVILTRLIDDAEPWLQSDYADSAPAEPLKVNHQAASNEPGSVLRTRPKFSVALRATPATSGPSVSTVDEVIQAVASIVGNDLEQPTEIGPVEKERHQQRNIGQVAEPSSDNEPNCSSHIRNTRRTKRSKSRNKSKKSGSLPKLKKNHQRKNEQSTNKGNVKRNPDPIGEYCHQLLSQRFSRKNDQTANRNRMLACCLCGKPVIVISKKGHILTIRPKRHALTHLETRFYRCRFCDQQRATEEQLKVHLLFRHRGHVTLKNWKNFLIDDTKLEENLESIMDMVRKCFDGTLATEDSIGKANDHCYGGGTNGQAAQLVSQINKSNRPPETRKRTLGTEESIRKVNDHCYGGGANGQSAQLVSRKNKSNRPPQTRDPIVDYCMNIGRKQVNGLLKCGLCKNTTLNVSLINSYGNIAQRIKTHALLHAGKHFYKCALCPFTAVTHVFMTRHINATHGKTPGGAKFEDHSSNEENWEYVIQAIKRCFDGEEKMDESVQEKRVEVQSQEIIVESEPRFIYLLPNGDLVLPDNIENYSGQSGVQLPSAYEYSSIPTIPPGSLKYDSHLEKETEY